MTKGRRRLLRHSLDAKTAKKAFALLFGELNPIMNEQKISFDE